MVYVFIYKKYNDISENAESNCTAEVTDANTIIIKKGKTQEVLEYISNK
jgi:hypothetical protein